MEVGSVQNVGHVTARLMKWPKNLCVCQRRAFRFVETSRARVMIAELISSLVSILCKGENPELQEENGQQDR